MLLRKLLLLVALSVLANGEDSCKNPRGNLSSFVGFGYDVLTDETKLSPYEETFDKQDMTSDNCFFVPDDVTVQSILKANESFVDLKNYTTGQFSKLISRGQNAEANAAIHQFDETSASFSDNVKKTRRFFQEPEVSTSIYHSQYLAYTLELKPGRTVNAHFKDRLESILKAIGAGNHQLAKHKAETLVRDYGTHVVTKANAWASTTVIGQIANRKIRDGESSENEMKDVVMAKAVVEGSRIGGADIATLEERVRKFRAKSGRVDFVAKGSYLRPAFAPSEVESYAPMPVAMEKLEAVAEAAVSSNENATVLKELVRQAVDDYFQWNTYRGCTEPRAANFNSTATVDDNSCIEFASFGGFYTSSPNLFGARSYVDEENPATGRRGCDIRYNRRVVSEIEESNTTKTLYWCHSSSANATEDERSVSFGGVVRESDGLNLLTGQRNCPYGFEKFNANSLLFGFDICFGNSLKSKQAYTLSRFGKCCQCSSMDCPLHYKEAIFKEYMNEKNEKCMIGACYYNGTLEDTSVRGEFAKHRALPFTPIPDAVRYERNELLTETETRTPEIPEATKATTRKTTRKTMLLSMPNFRDFIDDLKNVGKDVAKKAVEVAVNKILGPGETPPPQTPPTLSPPPPPPPPPPPSTEPPTTTTQPPATSNSSSSLDAGAIVGIVVGVILLLALIVGGVILAIYCVSVNKARENERQQGYPDSRGAPPHGGRHQSYTPRATDATRPTSTCTPPTYSPQPAHHHQRTRSQTPPPRHGSHGGGANNSTDYMVVKVKKPSRRR